MRVSFYSNSYATDDASKYGVCAILAQEHLWLGNLKDAEVRAREAIEAASHTPQAVSSE